MFDKTNEDVKFIIHDVNCRRRIGFVFLWDIDHKNNSVVFGFVVDENDNAGEEIGTQAIKGRKDFCVQ